MEARADEDTASLAVAADAMFPRLFCVVAKQQEAATPRRSMLKPLDGSPCWSLWAGSTEIPSRARPPKDKIPTQYQAKVRMGEPKGNFLRSANSEITAVLAAPAQALV